MPTYDGSVSGLFEYLFNARGGKLPLPAPAPGIPGGGATPGDNPFDLDQSTPKSGSNRSSGEDRVYVTYSLQGPNGEVYFGRTSGYGNPDDLVQARFQYHHMRLWGYGNPTTDKWASGDDGYVAIRGREQQLIDSRGGVNSPSVGNSINGISTMNPFRSTYIDAAKSRWGSP